MLLIVHRANSSRRPHFDTARRYVPRLGLLQHCPSWERAFADRVADADTRSVEECVAAARALNAEERVEGVVAFVEYAVSAAAAVAADLGLPGIGERTATLARDKFLMRRALSAGGVACPRFALARGVDEALRVGAEFGYPLVLKPVLGGGSQFVRRVDGPSDMTEHFPRLQAASWDSYAHDPLHASRAAYEDGLLVESYIDGGEVSVESVVAGGRTEVLAIHDKPLPMTGPVFAEILYTTPSRLPGVTQERLRECAARAHAALGIGTGATHAEFRVTPGGEPVVLEVAARVGGGAVYQSVRHSVGVDMVQAAIDLARGQRPALTRHEPRPVGELSLFAGEEGVLEEVSGVDEVAADPAVLELQIYKNPGDEIVTPPRAHQSHGHVLYTAATAAGLDQEAKRHRPAGASSGALACCRSATAPATVRRARTVAPAVARPMAAMAAQ
jgi:biotin carboxylase